MMPPQNGSVTSHVPQHRQQCFTTLYLLLFRFHGSTFEEPWKLGRFRSAAALGVSPGVLAGGGLRLTADARGSPQQGRVAHLVWRTLQIFPFRLRSLFV